jgi:hypothetical protein
MAGLDAVRVMSVLDEAVEGLRLRTGLLHICDVPKPPTSVQRPEINSLQITIILDARRAHFFGSARQRARTGLI